jgi:hypothetical protein
MDTIKLLLAHSDRRVANLIEVAVLDVCYDQAAVRSTRIARLDEFVRQGSLWDFDLIVVGAEHLFADRDQRVSARTEEVAQGIQTIRTHSSSPIIAVAGFENSHEGLLQAGAHSVLGFPFNSDQLKAEVRPLLDLTGFAGVRETNRWSAFGSLFKGLQKVRVGN